MKIQRMLPPVAARLGVRPLFRGLVLSGAHDRNEARLVAEFRRYFGVKHVFLVSSGKAALTLILLSLRALSPKRRVVMPAYTCFSVASSVVKAGLEMSLCDISPETLDFVPEQLEQSLEDEVLCVISTHLLGLPANSERAVGLCRKKRIFVVEDVAQAMGAKAGARLLGTIGDVGFFSFGRGKNVTCGAGGLIITDSDEIASAIQVQYDRLPAESIVEDIRSYAVLCATRAFIHPLLFWLPAQLKSLKLGETEFVNDFTLQRMGRTKLAVLGGWQERLEKDTTERRRAAAQVLEGLPQRVRAIRPQTSDEPAYLRLPVMLPDRDTKERLCQLSRQGGLGISPLYPSGIHHIPQLRDRLGGKEYPGATAVADQLVTIPVHRHMRQADLLKIHAVLLGAVHSSTSRTAARSNLQRHGNACAGRSH